MRFDKRKITSSARVMRVHLATKGKLSFSSNSFLHSPSSRFQQGSIHKRVASFPFTATMADDEPVDQKKYLEDSCKPKCVRPLRAYQACVERTKDDESGNKHCTGQYFDYWMCVDSCVAPKLFNKLK